MACCCAASFPATLPGLPCHALVPDVSIVGAAWFWFGPPKMPCVMLPSAPTGLLMVRLSLRRRRGELVRARHDADGEREAEELTALPGDRSGVADVLELELERLRHSTIVGAELRQRGRHDAPGRDRALRRAVVPDPRPVRRERAIVDADGDLEPVRIH